MLLVGLGTAVALAQSGTGVITCTVKDVAGERGPNGSVQARHVGTGAVTTASIAAGAYMFDRLPPGTYDLSVNQVRFVPFEQKGVVVDSGRSAHIDITLR